jgi:hypothetical protein
MQRSTQTNVLGLDVASLLLVVVRLPLLISGGPPG